MKDDAQVLIKTICDITNLSIKLSTLPDKFKIAKLTPLFKKGSKTDPKNYRPISLLSHISKFIKKAIHTQTQVYLYQNSLIYKFQSDSRLSQLTDYMIKDMDKGKHTGIILIDLQKVFATLNHNVLLYKNGMCRF